VTELVGRLRLRPLRLLAEMVDSAECVRHCRALGFHLFQGFFLRPPGHRGRVIRAYAHCIFTAPVYGQKRSPWPVALYNRRGEAQ
jgi:c-di-GMP-related signal transduction protein